VTEQNAASAEEVSAAAEETSSQLEEVTVSAQQLQQLAANLEELVGRFTLRRERDNLNERPVAAKRPAQFGAVQSPKLTRVESTSSVRELPELVAAGSHGNGNGHRNGNGNGAY
jgi:hypothetical protein